MALIVMTLTLAHAAGIDAANRQMTAEGRIGWNEEDYNLAARTSYELFPPCAEGYTDICECSRCVKVAA